MVRVNFLTATLIVAGLALATPSVVSAQSEQPLSTEEITNAFKKQKTRGLVIVPSSQQNTETEPNAVAEEPTTAVTNYTPVEEGTEVNIQISFDFDSAALREDQKPKLAALCEAMKAVGDSVFQVIGHTDSSGKASYNERLSLLRAEEVKLYLVTSCGIDADRLQAVGLGESAPLDADNPRADINRRVEFQALG